MVTILHRQVDIMITVIKVQTVQAFILIMVVIQSAVSMTYGIGVMEKSKIPIGLRGEMNQGNKLNVISV